MFFSKRTVYADAAAAMPLAPEARRVLIECLSLYANPGGLHTEGVEAKLRLENARKEAAASIGAHADEIVFTASGTEGNNLALEGVLDTYEAQNVAAVTLTTEHPSILETLRAYEPEGIQVTYCPVDHEGRALLSTLKEKINEKTVIISVALINSEIGVLQDVRAIAKMIRDERKRRVEQKNPLPLYFHIDACQAPLWVPLNVEQMHPDLMTLDGGKCGGPKGTGLLYVRRGTKLIAQTLGGGQERGFRAGTENVASIAAFTCALSSAQKNVEEVALHVAKMRDELCERILKNIPTTQVNGSREHRVANNLNISIPGLLGEMAVIALSARGVAASTRSACSTTDDDASHVLSAIGAEEARAQGALRFTLMPDVTKADVEFIAKALFKVYELYGKSNFDKSI